MYRPLFGDCLSVFVLVMERKERRVVDIFLLYYFINIFSVFVGDLVRTKLDFSKFTVQCGSNHRFIEGNSS
jgi:hypothetical protein